jgi:hypothetical protein
LRFQIPRLGCCSGPAGTPVSVPQQPCGSLPAPHRSGTSGDRTAGPIRVRRRLRYVWAPLGAFVARSPDRAGHGGSDPNQTTPSATVKPCQRPGRPLRLVRKRPAECQHVTTQWNRHRGTDEPKITVRLGRDPRSWTGQAPSLPTNRRADVEQGMASGRQMLCRPGAVGTTSAQHVRPCCGSVVVTPV